MKKTFPAILPGTFISQIITGSIAYYLLVSENRLRCSITNIIHYAHSLGVNQHLLLLGLLPIYIAFVIFGSALLGAAIGRWLNEQVYGPLRQKKSKISY
jgi:hypothetical protein